MEPYGSSPVSESTEPANAREQAPLTIRWYVDNRRSDTGALTGKVTILGWSIRTSGLCRLPRSHRRCRAHSEAAYRLGSDRGSPNHGSTLLSSGSWRRSRRR
jgi:hypothetical protein